MAFDQLKENADAQEDPEEEPADSDTDIEVLGDGDVAEEPETGGESPEPDGRTTPAGDTAEQERERPEPEQETQGADTTEVLRRIEQQNEEMLNVLRGIKRSLE